ncbi:kinesin-like protein KIF15-A isoform X4 [Oncorhynchus masou masou]|uniref:kinesin-like protein KIF15-A isoform X4 n=1 Tax=Oncorhynchus masou masou TaxID=90313 RepID=UPI0031833EDD
MTTSGWMFCPQMEVLQEELVYATKEVELLTKVLDEQASLLQASQYQTAQKEATTLQGKLKQQQEAVERTVRGESANHVPQSSVIPEVLPQVIELESRCSSMMTMEVPLTELNYERAAKNEEIQKLKGQLNEKEMVRMEIQAVFDELYAKQNQLAQNGNTNADVLNEAIHQNFLRELQEERSAMRIVIQRLTEAQERLKSQELLLAQSQTSVQELRNRCLEVSRKERDQE